MAETGSQRPANTKVEGSRLENERGLESESGGPRLVGSGPKLEDK